MNNQIKISCSNIWKLYGENPEKFLKEFDQSIAQSDLNESQSSLAYTLVNKMVLYRKKKNGNLYYVKESKK